MGEISDMMIDGVLCEHCGVFIGEPVGHPRYCSARCYTSGYKGDRRRTPKITQPKNKAIEERETRGKK